MSKVKSPGQKKSLSLKKDRRNDYGENAKASRKNIPRRKRESHQRERRVVSQELAVLKVDGTEDTATEAQVRAKQQARVQQLHAFKKKPDIPLGEKLRKDGKRP